MPDPACSTSMSEEQAAERNDQPSVTCPGGPKPSFMTELEPGSTVYFKAFVDDKNESEVKLRFPACKETKNKEVVQWVSRCSSRIWRGSLAKDAWSKVSNGEGAWRPKKRQRAAGRPGKKKGPRLDTGVRRASTSEQAEERQECIEGSAECPDKSDGDMATSQETVVYHDLPSDPLAAWFYKCDEGSGGTEEHDVVKAADNAGCEIELHGGRAKHGSKAQHAGSALERDDSAMEDSMSHGVQSKSVSRPSGRKADVALQFRRAIISAAPPTVATA